MIIHQPKPVSVGGDKVNPLRYMRFIKKSDPSGFEPSIWEERWILCLLVRVFPNVFIIKSFGTYPFWMQAAGLRISIDLAHRARCILALWMPQPSNYGKWIFSPTDGLPGPASSPFQHIHPYADRNTGHSNNVRLQPGSAPRPPSVALWGDALVSGVGSVVWSGYAVSLVGEYWAECQLQKQVFWGFFRAWFMELWVSIVISPAEVNESSSR